MLHIARFMLKDALWFHNSLRRSRRSWKGKADLIRDAREWCMTCIGFCREAKA